MRIKAVAVCRGPVGDKTSGSARRHLYHATWLVSRWQPHHLERIRLEHQLRLWMPRELASYHHRFLMPSDADVLVALAHVQIRAPGAGVAKLVQALRDDHPDWHPPVDSKRVRALRKVSPTSPSSPVTTIATCPSSDVIDTVHDVLHKLCAGGDEAFAHRAAILDMTLKSVYTANGRSLQTLPPLHSFTSKDYRDLASVYPARSCKLATTLLLLLVSPDMRLEQSLRWLSRALGGLPTATDVSRTPSADALSAYMRARKRAEVLGETTAIGVNLVDVEMLVRGGDDYESFAHSFTLLVSPAGMRVLQAWGEHGYSLGDNLKRDSSRMRSLQEGEDYMRDFARLSSMRGSWGKDINKLYARLFDVDVLSLMQGGGCMTKPIVPRFRAWVRVLEIPDIQRRDVERWSTIIDAFSDTCIRDAKSTLST
ncbi:unnamed protein product [Peniophora sp. CBMAI 1063]|nr:unnamed protein product [Peniophora sp. CBMAI 1063]